VYKKWKQRILPVIWLTVLLIFAAGGGAAEFGEAPMLQDKVADGELPPVEQRLPDPDQVYVVEVEEEIGRYGGTMRTAGIAIEGDGDDQMVMSFNSAWVLPRDAGAELFPHVIRDWDASDDMTTFTFYMREGMKWSDGEPFNADDVMFWYEHVFLNEDLTPWIGPAWRSDGEVVEVEKIDDYTVEFRYAAPKPFFVQNFIHDSGYNLQTPKHYLKQFHPDFTPMEELEPMIEEYGFDTWYELYGHKNNWQYSMPLNPDLPTLNSYVLTEITSDRRVYERNPYYWKVDEEGNQLPYIDRVENTVVSDPEVYQGMIVSGQLDFAGFEAEVDNYPMYREFEEEGNYRTLLWTEGYGSTIVWMFNLTHEDEQLREIFQDVRFRRAMSLGIDREEFNEIFFFGHGEPAQWTVLPDSIYYEPEFSQAYAEYDPERANELLDEMGLDERDSEGFRLMPNGERLMFTVEAYEFATVRMPRLEVISDYWRELGVDVRNRSISGELAAQRAPANLMDATVWHGDLSTDVLYPAQPYYNVPFAPAWSKANFTLWAQWFQTDGEEGEEPPEHIKEIRYTWEELMQEPDEERRIEMGKELLEIQAEKLWTIGIIRGAPQPVAVNKNLRNLPEDVLWCWDTLWTMSYDPEQFFFAE